MSWTESSWVVDNISKQLPKILGIIPRNRPNKNLNISLGSGEGLSEKEIILTGKGCMLNVSLTANVNGYNDSYNSVYFYGSSNTSMDIYVDDMETPYTLSANVSRTSQVISNTASMKNMNFDLLTSSFPINSGGDISSEVSNGLIIFNQQLRCVLHGTFYTENSYVSAGASGNVSYVFID